MGLLTTTITLILVMDPLGNVPVFLSVLNNIEPKRRSRIILRESLIACVILIIFLLAGKYILEGMQLSEEALSIAGGIILFLIAIRMIFPHGNDGHLPQHHGEPFIVPLAIPLIAGPSALAMVLLLSTHYPHELLHWIIAIIIAALVSTIVLLFSNAMRKVLGSKGLMAIERLMGMILTTLAVQMFLNGLTQYFHIKPGG